MDKKACIRLARADAGCVGGPEDHEVPVSNGSTLTKGETR